MPKEFQYRQFVNRDPHNDPVECVVEGVKSIIRLRDHLRAASQAFPNLKMSDADEAHFQRATRCYLCGVWGQTLVRDHCHFTGSHRGAACESCNRQLVLPNLPCLAHNYQGFDSGALLRALAQIPSKRMPQVINKSAEKQLCCTWEGLQFRDSMCLLTGSLAKLMHDTRKSSGLEAFPLMAERHPYRGNLDLLCCKLPM